MKVQADQLVRFLGQEFTAELMQWRGAEHPLYGYVEILDDRITIRCSRLLQISLESGIAPATKLFESGTGEYKVTAYQISAGMVYVQTNDDGDIWTKDGYIMLSSDIKLIRRTYDRQLPLEYAQDKGLFVW